MKINKAKIKEVIKKIVQIILVILFLGINDELYRKLRTLINYKKKKEE